MSAYLILPGLIAALLTACYLLLPEQLIMGLRKALRWRAGLALRKVRVGEINWPYLEGGNPSGEPLILVHGFGGDKDNWVLYARHVRTHYRLIFPDLPGFGDNDRSLEPDHSVAAQAARLRQFMDALGIEKCHLGGNSMGGAIALRFALDFPASLLSLTLFNNAGVLGTEESPLQRQVLAGERPLVVRSLADIDRLLRFIVFRPRPVPGRIKQVLFAEMKQHEALLDKIFEQVLDEVLNQPLNDRLGEVKAPTLIVWGRHDQLLDVSCAEVQHEGIANSELVIFEDAGHVPMIEKPRASAHRHLAFLAKH